MTKRLITCSVLGLRIKGVSQLTDYIRLVLRRQRRGIGLGLSMNLGIGMGPSTSSSTAFSGLAKCVAHGEPPQWLTEDRLAGWLKAERVVDIILGEPHVLKEHSLDGTHLEILKRADELLLFSAIHEDLSAAHLDLLWGAAGPGQSEAQLRAVYKLVIRCASKLSSELVDHVYAHIRRLPCQHEPLHIELFQGFAERTALRSSKARGLAPPLDGTTVALGLGIEILWADVQDESPVRADVAERATDALCTLLLKDNALAQLACVLERCVESIKRHSSASQALKIIHRLFDTRADSAAGSVSSASLAREKLLDDIEARHGLLGLVLAETTDYHRRACDAAADVSRGPSADGAGPAETTCWSERVLVGRRVTHRAALTVGLEVAGFVAENCTSTTLKFEHISALWGRLIQNPLAPDEPNLLLAWLARVAPDDELRHTPRRARMPAPAMSEETTRAVFQNLLCDPGIGMGSDADSLSAERDGSVRMHDSVRIDGYKCIEKLFRVVNRQEGKLRAATNRACFQVENIELTGVGTIWAVFLGVRDQAVSEAASEFIISLHLNLASGVDRRTAWAACFRRCLSHVQPAASTRTGDARLLEKAARIAGFLACFIRRLETVLPHAPDLREFPRTVLGEPEYFDTVFDLLLLSDSRVVENAFCLLQLLPQNKLLVMRLRDFGDAPNWPALLGGESILRLFYRLQIVESLTPADGGLGRWSQQFTASGGLKHLLGTLLLQHSADDLCASALTLSCVALLLKLITSFVTSAQEERAGSETLFTLAAVDSGTIVARLLELLRAISGIGDAPQHTKMPHRKVEHVQTFSPAAEVVGHALALLAGLALAEPRVLDVMREQADFVSTLLSCLLHTHHAVRKSTSEGIVRMCTGSSGACCMAQFFTGVLLESRQRAQSHSECCAEFFALSSQLVCSEGALDTMSEDVLGQHAAAMRDEIAKRPIIECGDQDVDVALQGLLALLKSLLCSLPARIKVAFKIEIGVGENGDTRGEALIAELVESLFAVPTNQAAKDGPVPPRCKHAETRALAFSLLGELCKECPSNHCVAMTAVASHHRIGLGLSAEERTQHKGAPPKSRSQRRVSLPTPPTALVATPPAPPAITGAQAASGLRGEASAKSTTGFVGLKNLGCICYMNSTLQQLFMVGKFREGILTVREPERIPTNSMMHQLQRMFAYLSETDRAYYDPREFCDSFKTWDGESINVFVQQDASEFLTMFFQQLEGPLMGTDHENLLKDTIGGTFSNELIANADSSPDDQSAESGAKYSERPEPFYYVSVDIKEHRSLPEALDKFISGETVDFAWESKDEDGNVSKINLPTTKQISIKTLPQHLLIHLKRFEFDFETLQQVKINSRFEFPENLDMFAYTKEGRQAGQGRAPMEESRERADDDDEEDETKDLPRPRWYYQYRLSGVVVHAGTANSGHYYSFVRARGCDSWYEFNDTVVTPFDVSNLEADCFGGEEAGAAGQQVPSADIPTTKAGSWGGMPREKIRNAFMLVYDRCEAPNGEPTTAVSSPARRAFTLPAAIMKEIDVDNAAFWRRRLVMDPAYFAFMESFLTEGLESAAAATPALVDEERSMMFRTVQLSTHFALGTLLQAGEFALAQQWVKRLPKLYTDEAEHANAESSAASWLLELLASEEHVSQELLVELGHEEMRVGIGELVAHVGGKAKRGAVIECQDRLFALLQTVHASGQRVGYLLHLLGQLVLVDSEYRAHFVSMGRLSALLTLVAAADHSRASGSEDDAGAWAEPDVGALLELVSTLVRSCAVVPEKAGKGTSPHVLEPQTRMPVADREALLCAEFASHLFRQISGPARKVLVSRLVSHLLWENQQVSEVFINVACAGVEREDFLTMKPYFRALMVMFQIRDSLENWRVAAGMAALLTAMEAAQRYVRATEMAIHLVIRVAKGNELASKWVAQNPKACKWMEAWLSSKRTNQMFTPGRSMHKPHQTSQQPGNAVAPPAISQPHLLANIRALLQGAALPHSGFDSDDDQTTLIGKRIRSVVFFARARGAT